MPWVCPTSLGADWNDAGQCNIEPIIEAINNICAELTTLTSIAQNEVAVVPTSTPSTSFGTYFPNGVPDDAFVLEGNNLWSTDDAGLSWNSISLVQTDDELRIVPGGTSSAAFNGFFPSGTPASDAFVLEGNNSWITATAGAVWTQLALKGNSVRVVPALTPTEDFNAYFINALPDEHAAVFDTNDIYITNDFGASWTEAGLKACTLTVQSLATMIIQANNGFLSPGCVYVINDNGSAEGGDIYFVALQDSSIPDIVLYENSVTGQFWPAIYDGAGQILRMWDDKGNDISGAIAVNTFQWNNALWTGNIIEGITAWTDDGAAGEFSNNNIRQITTSLDTSGNTGVISGNDIILTSVADLSANTGTIESNILWAVIPLDLSSNTGGTISDNVMNGGSLDLNANTGTITSFNSERPTSITVTGNSGTVKGNYMGDEATLTATSNAGSIRGNRFERNSSGTLNSNNAGTQIVGNHVRTGSTLNVTSAINSIFKMNELNDSSLTSSGANGSTVSDLRLYALASFSFSTVTNVTVEGGDIGDSSVVNFSSSSNATAEDIRVYGASLVTITSFTGSLASLFTGNISTTTLTSASGTFTGIYVDGQSTCNLTSCGGTIDGLVVENGSTFTGNDGLVTGSVSDCTVKNGSAMNINGGHAGVIEDSEIRSGHTANLRKNLGSSISRLRAAGTGVTAYAGAGNVLDIQVAD